MFIKNGKSLFGNTGLIVALIILCILLYLSYNKCYVGGFDESFTCPDPSNPDCPIPTQASPPSSPPPASSPNTNITTPPPTQVRVVINGSTVKVNFTIDTSKSNQIPTKFVVVLAQYDNTKKNTGNNKFILSNESVINSLVNDNYINSYKNMCSLSSNNRPTCQHVFNNLDIRDDSGNLYYYKLGVSAVYSETYNSPFVMPQNISSPDNKFTLDSSAEQQSQLFTNFLEYKNAKANQPSANIYDTTIATADGQYELIKSQLGNYPDYLTLEYDDISNGNLSDLIDKSMAQGILNVKVN